MNILIATYWTYPHVGGLSTYINNLEQELTKAGHQVDIFAHHPSYEFYYFANNGKFKVNKEPIWNQVNSHVAKTYGQLCCQNFPWICSMEAERYCYEIACSLCQLQKYDIIHTQDIVSTIAFSRVKPKGVPLVSTLHGCFTTEFYINGTIDGEGTPTWNYSAFQELLGLQVSQQTIVPTDWLRNILVSLDNDSVLLNRFIRIPYGITPPQKSGSNKKRNPAKNGNKKIISCVARLTHVKGHKYLINALSQLKENRQDWECWLVGDGNLRSELESQVKQLGLENNILFFGARADVMDLLEDTDIVVLPSLQDNLPYAIIEAQFMGRAVVGSNVGGIPEMIRDGQNGIISEKANSDSLFRSIQLLLDDHNLRFKLGQKACRWARQEYLLERMLEKTLNVYNDIIQKEKLILKEASRNEVESFKKLDRVLPPVNNPSSFMDLKQLKKIINLNKLPPSYSIPDPIMLKAIPRLQ